jgi:translation elongation factor Ts
MLLTWLPRFTCARGLAARAQGSARGLVQAINADLIKQLRQRTGAPINKCKQALEAEKGDLDGATSWLRKSGIATAQKKAGRGAHEGVVGALASDSRTRLALIELNSETDFVARNDVFQQLSRSVASAALQMETAGTAPVTELDGPSLLAQQIVHDGQAQTVEEVIVSGITALGTRAAAPSRLPPFLSRPGAHAHQSQ